MQICFYKCRKQFGKRKKKKKKMLVTSIFSFSLNVFKRHLHRVVKSPCFYVSVVQLLKILLEKEKLLVTSNFSFSNSVFYPFRKISSFTSNLKLSSANSISLEESKICRLGKNNELKSVVDDLNSPG